MTEEHPPKDAYDAHFLRKLLNKSIARTDHEPTDETTGVVLPTVEVAYTLRPLFREDVVLVAPQQDGVLVNVRTNEQVSTDDIDGDQFVDLRLTDVWTRDADE